MKPLSLLLNVVLVAGGIFVYDAVVRPSSHGPVPVHDPVDLPRADLRGPEAPVPEPPAMRLEGRGEEVWRGLVERRLAALETEPRPAATRPTTTAVADERREGRREPDTSSFLPDVGPREAPVFTDREVATFEALYEQMERKRRTEQNESQINRRLEQLGLSLTDSQRRDVIAATVQFQQRVRELFRGGEGPADRESRQTAMDGVREQYRRTLFDVLPASDAERIVEALASVRGRGATGPGGAEGGGQFRPNRGERPAGR